MEGGPRYSIGALLHLKKGKVNQKHAISISNVGFMIVIFFPPKGGRS